MTFRRPGDRPPLGLRLLVGEGHGLLLQPAHHLAQAGLALAPPHPAGLLEGVRRQVEPQHTTSQAGGQLWRISVMEDLSYGGSQLSVIKLMEDHI